MKEHIVITGASGLVGRALLRNYLAQGRPVIALSRKPPVLPDLGPASHPLLSWHWGDVSLPRLGLAPAAYAEVCAKAQLVFHLAARTDFKDGTAAPYLPVNLEGVKHVLTLAQEAKAPLHQVSTAFVCGDWPGEFRENDLNLGQHFRNGYEESKFLGESFLHGVMTAASVPITIHRPGIVVERNPSAASGKTFGPFLFLDAVARLRDSAEAKGVAELPVLRVQGNRQAHLPLVFDDAVAEALVRLAAQPKSGGQVFQLVAPEPVGNLLLEDAFNEAFGQPAARFAGDEEFSRQPANPLEALLTRKTTPYAAYLDLSVHFTRRNLDTIAGAKTLPTPTRAELAQAFRAFLAARSQRSAP
ncbi:MAG: SDR family oxidoreductase [Desulfobulbia bacterium]